jgi:hypothetical protein
LRGLSAPRGAVLDETTFVAAAGDPHFMRGAARSLATAEIGIGAYGVACIESGR